MFNLNKIWRGFSFSWSSLASYLPSPLLCEMAGLIMAVWPFFFLFSNACWANPVIAIERSYLEKLPKTLNPSVNKSHKHYNLQIGLERSNLYLGSAFPTLRGDEMMNELIFVQGFEEKQCLKCWCVLTSNFTSAEFSVRKLKETVSKNTIKHFFPLLPQTASLHGGGQRACGWRCVSRAILAGPMRRVQPTGLSSVATRTFWVSVLWHNTQSLPNVWGCGFSLVLFPLKFTTQCPKFSVSVLHSPNI